MKEQTDFGQKSIEPFPGGSSRGTTELAAAPGQIVSTTRAASHFADVNLGLGPSERLEQLPAIDVDPTGGTTTMLVRWANGDTGVLDQLTERIYGRLRQLARQVLNKH